MVGVAHPARSHADPAGGAHGAQRRKDVEDVTNVIAVQANHIDWDYINQWCDLHGTRSLLDEIRASIPPI